MPRSFSTCGSTQLNFSLKEFFGRCVKIDTYNNLAMRGIKDGIQYPRINAHLKRVGGVEFGIAGMKLPSENFIAETVLKAKADAEHDLAALGNLLI